MKTYKKDGNLKNINRAVTGRLFFTWEKEDVILKNLLLKIEIEIAIENPLNYK